jgi:hypothetical protein
VFSVTGVFAVVPAADTTRPVPFWQMTNYVHGHFDYTTVTNIADSVSNRWADARYVNAAGDAMSGPLDMGGNPITNLAAPAAASHAVNLAYLTDRRAQFTNNALAYLNSMTVSHAPDAAYQRIVQVAWQKADGLLTNDTLDFDPVDRPDYAEENPTNGTTFDNGIIRLYIDVAVIAASNSVSGGKPACASSQSGLNVAGRANDGNVGTYWQCSGGTASGQWWQVDLQTTQRWARVRVNFPYADPLTYAPSNWLVLSSVDSNTWTMVTNVYPLPNGEWQTNDLATLPARFLRFECLQGHNAADYGINELEVYPATFNSNNYPTTPFYVTTKDNALDTATWTNLVSLSISQSTSPDTDLRYLVSFDGRATWKYHAAGWQTAETPLKAGLLTNGMAKATIESITSPQWTSAGGLNSAANATLDFALLLWTTNASATPAVSQITALYREPEFWQFDTRGDFLVRAYSPSNTTVRNLSGRTRTVRVNILLP